MPKLSEEEALLLGSEQLEAEQYEAALPHLSVARERDPDNACLRSRYGLCLGLVEHDFEKALALCRSAVKQEFFNPDLYLNLAHLHLAFGFKADGIRHLRRGLMIDPGHAEICGQLERLGARREPVLEFLPRRHLLNRWLGRARSRLAQHRGVLAA